MFGAYENAVESLGSSDIPSSHCQPAHRPDLPVSGRQSYPQGKYPCVRNGSDSWQDVSVTPACLSDLPVSEPSFSRNNRYNDGSFYAQDTWKVTPRLTLNLGLRWDYYGVQHNSNPSLDSNFYLGSGIESLPAGS